MLIFVQGDGVVRAVLALESLGRACVGAVAGASPGFGLAGVKDV